MPERKVAHLLASPPFVKGDLARFQSIIKSPLAPLYQRGEDFLMFMFFDGEGLLIFTNPKWKK